MNDTVRIVIEGISPQVDSGRFPVKAIIGDRLTVGADIWKDGHELLKAAVVWRKAGSNEIQPGPPRIPNLRKKGWQEAPMESEFRFNDRWFGKIEFQEIGLYTFAVIAWTDVFGSWCEELRKKIAAGQHVTSELLEGMALIEKTAAKAKSKEGHLLLTRLEAMKNAKDDSARAQIALSPETSMLMEKADPRSDLQMSEVELPIWVDRVKARFGTWYEMFPRSSGTDPSRSATFSEAEHRLPQIAAMGFDVLYLPPIHPIGRLHRKGPNNIERGNPTDPGSPWAIGSEDGGHTAVHTELGTIEDFDHFLETAKKVGIELALDFAIQCSPDHPWVKEHPEWFSKRPDGSIKYAENPPKKYQDIYPINFETEDREGLYKALLDVVLFWADRGVRIFRVDNPHTKPAGFWEWLIWEVHKKYPETLFLAEAFTRPKRMKRLAKAGFSQSYTYFTWRNSKVELEEYCTELFLTETRDFFRPNFFVNTPDILHEILQKGGRPAFIMRLVLAATLSPTYGIYSGFEVCENKPLREGSEEYLDSEKYQVKVWDWDRPGNIRSIITQVNKIRYEHKSLQLADNIQFLRSSNSHILAFAKATPEFEDVLVVVVNTDPYNPQEGVVTLTDKLFASRPRYGVTDLLTGANYTWRGPTNYVRLDPNILPAHVLRVNRQD